MRRTTAAITLTLAGTVLLGLLLAQPAKPTPPYRSPYDVAFSPDGATLAVSDHTAGMVALVDAKAQKAARQVPLNGRPASLVWSADGARLYVAEYGAAAVAEIDAKAGRVLRQLPAGRYVSGLALAPERNLLLALDAGLNAVSVIDLAAGTEKARIDVSAQPFAAAVAPDGALAVVTNLLPAGDATAADHAAAVSLIDLERLERAADVRLPAGSTGLRGVAVSPDGRWAYAVHTVGRFTLPTTQLERGWVNTNALSILDLARREVYATVLLDLLSEGAADPWGVIVSKDGGTAWVTLSGVHQVARIDLANLHRLLAGELKDPAAVSAQARQDPSTMNVWLEIRKDTSARRLLVNDLAALYSAGLIRRTPVAGKGPRGLDLSPDTADGLRLAVATYFAGHVALVDGDSGKVAGTILLGPDREADVVRRGETAFHDATQCFQHWLSCATCHPDGRADGMNWDLLNDGMGNPKNARSLVWSHKTPPVMSRGVRASMDVAAAAGFRFILFIDPGEAVIDDVRAYLRSLEPMKSPHLVNGALSPAAKRGKAIFESPETGCVPCHPAPLFTDLKLYDVGTRGELDQSGTFDNPTLVELWRTAPYLHDGSAPTLRDVLTTRNKGDKHGKTSHLTKEEIEDLVAYLLSL